MLIVQVAWLVALVPGLVAGTLADGISGAAWRRRRGRVRGAALLSHLAGQVRDQVTDLAKRIWLSVTVAAAVAGTAAVAARMIRADLAALAVAALAILAGFALLAGLMRPAIAELRRNLTPQPPAAPPDPAAPAAAPA